MHARVPVQIEQAAKVDELAAPHQANIHYLGRKPYAELPAYLARFGTPKHPDDLLQHQLIGFRDASPKELKGQDGSGGQFDPRKAGTVQRVVCGDSNTFSRSQPGIMREAVREPHTWVISFLYIGTFGSFLGFSLTFPTLMKAMHPDVPKIMMRQHQLNEKYRRIWA